MWGGKYLYSPRMFFTYKKMWGEYKYLSILPPTKFLISGEFYHIGCGISSVHFWPYDEISLCAETTVTIELLFLMESRRVASGPQLLTPPMKLMSMIMKEQ